MKKLTFIIACFLMATKLLAQDCSHFLYLQKDKTIEMTGYRKNGDISMKSVSKVSDVTISGGVTKANVTSQVFDKNGKLLGTSSVDYKCSGGVITMQMHIAVGQQGRPAGVNMNFSINTSSGDFPPDMKVGDNLKDYTSEMDMGNGMTTNIKITDRFVAAKESVTTPAGTWVCFKITYKTSASTVFNGMKMPSSSIESTIWYSRDAGMVKSESKNGSMELTCIK